MYLAKDVINKMKQLANLNSNVDLANNLGISYNTLNTWIKRGKLPQETIFSFCKDNNCSLDYLLLDKEPNLFEEQQKDYKNNQLKTSQITDIKEDEFIYYANFEELNISYGSKIKLHPTLRISNGYYLLKKDSIYFIAKCKFDLLSRNTTLFIENIQYQLTYEEFELINLGLIIDFN